MSTFIKELVENNIVEDPESIPDEDIWNLDFSIAKYALPRLVAFRDRFGGRSIPGDLESSDEWIEIQDDIIYALEYSILFMEGDTRHTKLDRDRIRRGIEMFGKYFYNLWD